MNVQADSASIVELEQCLQTGNLGSGGNLNLAKFLRYCHSWIEQLFGQLVKDDKLQALFTAEGLLQDEGFWQGWEINLLLCSDSRMAHWNRQFRGTDQPTDILSFSSGSSAGDLLLSLRSWLANCREFDCRPDEELQRLLLHGLLHLAGWDHNVAERPQTPKSPMLIYQETVLKKMRKGFYYNE